MEKLVTQFEKLKQRVISGHERATVLRNKISSGVEFDDDIRTHIAEFVNCRDVYDHLHNGRKYKTFKDLVTKEDNAPPELKTLCEKVIDLKSKVDEEMDGFRQVAVAIENSSPLIGSTVFERRSYFNPINKDVLSKVVPPPPEVDPPKAPPPNYGLCTLDELFEKFKKDEYNYFMFKPNIVTDRTIKTWVRLVKKETEEGLNRLFILVIEYDIYRDGFEVNDYHYICYQSTRRDGDKTINLYDCIHPVLDEIIGSNGNPMQGFFDQSKRLMGDQNLMKLDEKFSNNWEELGEDKFETEDVDRLGVKNGMKIIDWIENSYPPDKWPSMTTADVFT